MYIKIIQKFNEKLSSTNFVYEKCILFMGAYNKYTTNTQGIMIFLVGAQTPNSINMHPPLVTYQKEIEVKLQP
jgi:hypothetical protein